MFKQFFNDIKVELLEKQTINLVNEEKITNYILCTKKHFEDVEYTDSDLNLFLDFDLSSLGDDRENYKRNSFEIKYEYCNHLTTKEWIDGRKNFLTFVLKKKRIFRTEIFYKKFEAIAKENIEYEIENLK